MAFMYIHIQTAGFRYMCTLYSTCVMLCRKLVLGVLTDSVNGVIFLIAEPQSQRPAGFETVSSLCRGSNFIWQVYIIYN